MTPAAAPPGANIGPWISVGVALVRRQLGPWVLLASLSLLPGLVVVLLMALVYGLVAATVMPRALEGPDAPADPGALLGQAFFGGPLILLGALLAAVVAFWLTIGLYRAALRQVDGEVPGTGHLRGNLPALPRVMGAAALAGAVTSLGLVLCVVPGLLATGRLQFAVPLAIDRGLSPVEALRASWEATRADTLGYTLHALAVGMLSGLGAHACGVGMVLTWPLFFTATAVAYRDVFGPPPAPSAAA